MSLTRVLLADDHLLVREALARLLDAEPDLDVTCQCVHGQEALAAIRAEPLDVAVLDVHMPRLSGLEVADRLGQLGEAAPPVVLLTAYRSRELARRARRRGVRALVFKDDAFEDLVLAIRCAVRGEPFASAGFDGAEAARGRLSERELQVVGHVADGLSNKQIADRLGISPKTVDNHRTRVMAKLDTHSTAELVRYAVRAGIVEP